MVEVVGHDVHEHEEAAVGLLGHGEQVAQRAVQGGEPGQTDEVVRGVEGDEVR